MCKVGFEEKFLADNGWEKVNIPIAITDKAGESINSFPDLMLIGATEDKATGEYVETLVIADVKDGNWLAKGQTIQASKNARQREVDNAEKRGRSAPWAMLVDWNHTWMKHHRTLIWAQRWCDMWFPTVKKIEYRIINPKADEHRAKVSTGDVNKWDKRLFNPEVTFKKAEAHNLIHVTPSDFVEAFSNFEQVLLDEGDIDFLVGVFAECERELEGEKEPVRKEQQDYYDYHQNAV